MPYVNFWLFSHKDICGYYDNHTLSLSQHWSLLFHRKSSYCYIFEWISFIVCKIFSQMNSFRIIDKTPKRIDILMLWIHIHLESYRWKKKKNNEKKIWSDRKTQTRKLKKNKYDNQSKRKVCIQIEFVIRLHFGLEWESDKSKNKVIPLLILLIYSNIRTPLSLVFRAHKVFQLLIGNQQRAKTFPEIDLFPS